MKHIAAVLLGLVLVGCRQGRDGPPGAAAAPDSATLTMADRRLLAAATIALPPTGMPAESLPEPGSHAAQLLTGFCTQCHALPSPAMHAAQDWPSVARRMWVWIDMMQGMLGVTSPTAADRIQLLDYLLANSLRVSAHLPAGRGRGTFEAICTRCHGLPDPRAHSPADWPTVVMRMERNMERMKVGGVTPGQTQEIVMYLERASRR